MTWSRARYEDVWQQMQPGDVIAFGGRGGFAGIIKWATLGTVNHVAVVLSADPPADGTAQEGPASPHMHRVEPPRGVRIIESTSTLDEFPGVNARELGDRIEGHPGEIWWLPLNEETRQKLDLEKFIKFLNEQLGKGYDSLQAVKSAWDDFEDAPVFGLLTHSKENFSRFFCSELVAAGLEAGGAIRSLNSSEVTPMDLCTFSIFQETYYQLKGDRKLIEGYNRLDPEGFGELPEPTSFKQKLQLYPILPGLIISCTLLCLLLLQEVLLGRLVVVFGPTGSPRDLRLAIIHCLLAGYFPSACLYLLRGMRTTAGELAGIVVTDRNLPEIDLATSIGESIPVGVKSLALAGLLGLLLAVLFPLLTAETAAWDPSTWYPEVWWHRLLGLFIGWWFGWFVLAIWYTSMHTSRLADWIPRIDLLDLRPLSPFVKQGLLTSLLAVGAASLLSLFLLEPGHWPVVVISIAIALPLALAGLLLPVRGVHRRIRRTKEAELEWTRERIRRASAFVYKLSAPESPGQLADLCAYRQLIKDVPEWPIEGAARLQVVLYMAIPVVSWFGSLLIENLLGFLFG